MLSCKDEILDMLKSGPCTNGQLSKVSLRYGAYIHELRHEDGYIIPRPTLKPNTRGTYIYELKGRREVEQ